MHFRVSPSRRGVRGSIRVPGDKSISHRALILAAIAEGSTRIRGLLEGDDVLATLRAIQAMGVTATSPCDGKMTVEGVGLRGLKAPREALDLGNSGTAMRLLAGLLAGQSFGAELVGDESLSTRPMLRVAQPLQRMGALVKTASGGTPPIVIQPVAGLRAIEYRLPIASAQVKSALLLAALYAKGRTCIEEPSPTRDHTERMLEGFGYACERTGNRICLSGGGKLHASDVDIPADVSSAAFFVVAALLAGSEQMCMRHVGTNPTRTGLLEILRRMGARIEEQNRRTICGEPVADLMVTPSTLHGIEVPTALVPLAIDEIPILCVAAAHASGRSVIRGAEELRHKESDRIVAMVTGLRKLGIAVEEYADGLAIQGGHIGAGTVDSFADHRVAMAFCMAALTADGPVTIRDCDNVSTSFPNFLEVARSAGMGIDARE
jgi:3-phosphoshikimate 1-carboxyvinyltransferase